MRPLIRACCDVKYKAKTWMKATCFYSTFELCRFEVEYSPTRDDLAVRLEFAHISILHSVKIRSGIRSRSNGWKVSSARLTVLVLRLSGKHNSLR
jgi:hypothetical protein